MNSPGGQFFPALLPSYQRDGISDILEQSSIAALAVCTVQYKYRTASSLGCGQKLVGLLAQQLNGGEGREPIGGIPTDLPICHHIIPGILGRSQQSLHAYDEIWRVNRDQSPSQSFVTPTLTIFSSGNKTQMPRMGSLFL